MNPSSHQDFFRTPSIADRLNLFQYLFDSGEIQADLALALLKVIHGELSNEQTRDRSVYRRYSFVVQALRYHKAGLLQQVVDAWNITRKPKDPEWLANGRIK
jgi:hypothetical protein